jgi:hypothetical protein
VDPELYRDAAENALDSAVDWLRLIHEEGKFEEWAHYLLGRIETVIGTDALVELQGALAERQRRSVW